jgi:hypothetical protein
MKAYGGVGVYIHVILTSPLAGSEWSASRSSRFNPGESTPGTLWVGGWVVPRASLDDMEERKFFTLPGLELRPLSHPARSQSLYQLNYPGSHNADTALKCYKRIPRLMILLAIVTNHTPIFVSRMFCPWTILPHTLCY